MARPKGSKNKVKETMKSILTRDNPELVAKFEHYGNDVIAVLNDAERIAPGAITAEDLALDRELDLLARNSEPDISDREPIPAMKKGAEPFTLLSEYTNCVPAKTIQELDELVFKAKHYEADSVEASPALVKYFCKGDYPDKVGYFVYHDIKVYIAGFFEQSIKRDKESIEQRNFGASKIV